MTENLRETFRVEPDAELECELFHEGRVAPCTLHNLSAGGAKVSCTLPMAAGAQCTLGVRLSPSLRGSTHPAYVSFLMEVAEASPREDEGFDVRLRSTTGPGSPQFEAASKLVFATQRRLLAQRSGSEAASPMHSDPERRGGFRRSMLRRFGKRSLRPDQD